MNEPVKSDFERVLAENAAAKIKFDALTEPERAKLRDRAARAASFDSMRDIVNDFVGWQEGHGPYQC